MSAMEQESVKETTTAEREVVISRVIDAPRELVFEAFTDVRHLSQWWGPEGFTTTTRTFDFRVGGLWDHVMHRADGSDHDELLFWTEIVPPQRLAWLNGDAADDPNGFHTLLEFTADGERTRIEMRTLFPSKEARDRAVQKSGAIKGGEQMLAKLEAFLKRRSTQTRT
jgi:uncharacterized protein YndB with AHSA1/START domain